MTTSMHTRSAAIAALTALLAGAGCTSGAFEARNDNVVLPGAVAGVNGLPAFLLGARSDFAFANAGDDSNQEGQLLISGLVADEFQSFDTFPTRQEIDFRSMNTANATLEGAERSIQRARVAALKGAAKYRELAPDSTASITELQAIAALATTIIAENYCGAVPLSTYGDDGSLQYGPPQTTQQLLATAVALADSALAVRPNDPFASVVKGRALLNAGSFAAAGAAVAGVPTSFQQQNFYAQAPTGIVNGAFSFFYVRAGYSTADVEGGVGLPYLSDADPRVGIANPSPGPGNFPAAPDVEAPTKYPSKSSPVTIADGVEARLIQAEAALQASNFSAFTSNLNAARAVFGLGPVTDPGTASGRRDLLFKERAYALFATGHRLGDLRRLVRQYGLPVNSVFPNGPWFRGGDYGNQVAIPISLAESNNPLVGSPACDPTVP